MGIALPKWIIEGKNNIWVLGAYGLVFGGALPALVGRWWFGNRQKTKDGIQAESAAAFFKTVKEESSTQEVVGALGKAYKWEMAAVKPNLGLDELEKAIESQLGASWTEIRKLLLDYNGDLHESRRRALVLIYAHLLRLDIHDAGLKKRGFKCSPSTAVIAQPGFQNKDRSFSKRLSFSTLYSMSVSRELGFRQLLLLCACTLPWLKRSLQMRRIGFS